MKTFSELALQFVTGLGELLIWSIIIFGCFAAIVNVGKYFKAQASCTAAAKTSCKLAFVSADGKIFYLKK